MSRPGDNYLAQSHLAGLQAGPDRVAEPPGWGPFGVADLPGQDGPDPAGMPGVRRWQGAGERAGGLFECAQPPGQVTQGRVSEAGPGFPALRQAGRCLDTQQQRAQDAGAGAMAGDPPADHHVRDPLVLDLQPPRGAAPGHVGRVQLFEHHAFQPMLAAGGQHRLAAARETGRHASLRAGQAQGLQQGAALRVGSARRVPRLWG